MRISASISLIAILLPFPDSRKLRGRAVPARANDCAAIEQTLKKLLIGVVQNSTPVPHRKGLRERVMAKQTDASWLIEIMHNTEVTDALPVTK